MTETKELTKKEYYELHKHETNISYNNFCRRIREKGVSYEEAIKPKTKNKYDERYIKFLRIAESNGITDNVFHSRVRALKWSYEKASTQPVRPKKLTKIQKDVAKANNINEKTLNTRLNQLGWSIEDAITNLTGSNVLGQEPIIKGMFTEKDIIKMRRKEQAKFYIENNLKVPEKLKNVLTS